MIHEREKKVILLVACLASFFVPFYRIYHHRPDYPQWRLSSMQMR